MLPLVIPSTEKTWPRTAQLNFNVRYGANSCASARGRQYSFAMMPESGRTVIPRAAAEQDLDFRLFGNLQGVIDLDTEVADGALQFGMPEQQLDGAQILRALVDQRRFGPPHRVRSVG